MRTRTFGAAIVAMLLGSVLVYAGNAHFVGDPTISISGETVTVSGKVAGLGNVPQIHVVVTADAQCVNGGGNKPSAANKASFSAEGDFPVQNGRASFAVPVTATFQPDCTPPMTVSWSNISVTVTAADGTYLVYP